MTMTYQRRRGQQATIYRSKEITDSRDNVVKMVDEDNPYVVRAWVIPQRSSRAELPGQQDIQIIRLGTTAELAGVDSWSRVFWNGAMWDVVVPPAFHNGTRHTRHWTIDLRRRP